MPVQKPEATIIVKFFDGNPEVTIVGFDKLKPSYIDRAYDKVQTEWNRLRSQAVMKANKGLLKKKSEALATKPEEAEEAENVG